MWRIERYTRDRKDEWNAFIRSSRNSTFLFDRDFMDYHADRFEDCSLMAYRNGKPAAMLPGNISDCIFYSHQGLTYGGWCLPKKPIDASDLHQLWEEWIKWCRHCGIEAIIYKPLPTIYQLQPSEEDRYFLLKYGRPEGVSLSSTINLRQNPGFNELQKRHIKNLPGNVVYNKIKAGDNEGIRRFHSLLSECLQSRHGAVPVHTEEELARLISLFPENIAIYEAQLEGKSGAAICGFITKEVFHCQYIVTSEEGRKRNILPGLILHLTEFASAHGYSYFDLGTSNEPSTGEINPGLNRQKTSFGATGIVYERWRINLT